MTKRLLLTLCLTYGLSLVSRGAEFLPAGYVAPVDADASQEKKPEEGGTWVRGSHTIRLLLRDDEELEGTLRWQRVGSYNDAIQYRLTDSDGLVKEEGRIPAGTSDSFAHPNPDPGLYLLRVDSGMNAFSFETSLRHCIYVASEQSPLRMIYRASPLYFWVPKDAEQVRLKVAGGGGNEAAGFRVLDAQGTVLAEGDSLHEEGRVNLEVDSSTAGSAWSVSFHKMPDLLFEDLSLSLAGDAIPFVTKTPEALAVPALHPYGRIVEGRPEFGVRLHTNLASLLRLTVKDRATGTPLLDETYESPRVGRFGQRMPVQDFLHVTITGRLFDRQNKQIFTCERSCAAAHGELFEELPHVETHAPPPPSQAELQRGFQVFSRSEPGEIRPTSRPRKQELTEEVTAFVTPGEVETLYVALYPLRDMKDVQVTLGPFRNPVGQEIRGITAELQWVTCWPQLTDWSSKTFHVIPELLERRESGDLRKAVPQQFAIRVTVPEKISPRKYSVPLIVRRDDDPIEAAQLHLDVLPFRLWAPPPPRPVVWGLYPDTARWKTFTDQQIREELRDFQAHGINALMLYPQWNTEWSLKENRLSADFSEFRRRMRLCKEVGLKGPFVMSLQGAEVLLQKLIEEEALSNRIPVEDLYKQMLSLIREEAEESSWPTFYVHSVDEPHSGDKLEAALRTLRLIKEMGFKTFNTCYGKAVRDTLDPYLDVRCYNNIGFLSFPDADAARSLFLETYQARDTFWWYGTGCYTNRNFIQDGNVVANRFMAGVHFWRTQATGCWAWTFLRPKGSPFDDFDGAGHREGKDACIAYPQREGVGLIPTLQWEGLREGVDDYRYLLTLQMRILMAREDPKLKNAADQAEAEMKRLLKEMPWTCRDGAVTNEDLDQFRERVVELMKFHSQERQEPDRSRDKTPSEIHAVNEP